MAKISKFLLDDFTNPQIEEDIKITSIADLAESIEEPTEPVVKVITIPENEYIKTKEDAYNKGLDEGKENFKKEIIEENRTFHLLAAEIQGKVESLKIDLQTDIENSRTIFTEILLAAIERLFADKTEQVREAALKFSDEILTKLSGAPNVQLKINTASKAKLDQMLPAIEGFSIIIDDSISDYQSEIKWESGLAKIDINKVKEEVMENVKKYFTEQK
jgi:flagellar biosynthesis/type III secretory pathway protein FliH